MFRNKNSKILLSIVVSLIFLNIFSTLGYCFDPETTTVKANWLFVQAGDFVDTSPHSWEDDFHIITGGEDLLDLKNIGIITSSESEVVYKAEATFGFEVIAYTSAVFRDIFPEINLEKENKVPYFAVIIERFAQLPALSTYSINYKSIDYGATKNYPQYKGTIPLTVGIKELTSNSGNLVLNGEEFSFPEYKADVLQTEVKMVRAGVVGEYTDNFTDNAGIKQGTVKFQPVDDFSLKEQAIIDYWNNQKLGWTAGEIERGQTLQQSVVDGSPVGSTFHNADPKNNRQFTFSLPVNLQPEVYEYVQYNTIKYAGIRYWTWGFWDGNIDALVQPSTKVLPKRVVAVHVNNNFIKWDFKVSVDFYATMPSTAELTEAILDDPYLKMGDWVWDTSITGDYEVEVPLDKFNFADFLDWLLENPMLLIIIVIVAIVGLYLVYRFFIKKKQMPNINVNVKK